MEFLGINIEVLMFGLIYIMFLIIILCIFIFCAVSVFTLDSSFGSIVNSAFPIGIYSFFLIFFNLNFFINLAGGSLIAKDDK